VLDFLFESSIRERDGIAEIARRCLTYGREREKSLLFAARHRKRKSSIIPRGIGYARIAAHSVSRTSASSVKISLLPDLQSSISLRETMANRLRRDRGEETRWINCWHVAGACCLTNNAINNNNNSRVINNDNRCGIPMFSNFALQSPTSYTNHLSNWPQTKQRARN